MATTFSVPRAPRASQSGVPIIADTQQLSRLARDLNAAAPEAWKACRLALRAAGLLVAADAKERASFSTRIPASIRVRTGHGNVKVIAGDATATDAAPIENKGKGFVRHPVFEVSVANGGGGRYYGSHRNAPRPGLSRAGGIAPWTSKNSHPAYLAPALDAHREEVLKMVENAVADATVALIEAGR